MVYYLIYIIIYLLMDGIKLIKDITDKNSKESFSEFEN